MLNMISTYPVPPVALSVMYKQTVYKCIQYMNRDEKITQRLLDGDVNPADFFDPRSQISVDWVSFFPEPVFDQFQHKPDTVIEFVHRAYDAYKLWELGQIPAEAADYLKVDRELWEKNANICRKFQAPENANFGFWGYIGAVMEVKHGEPAPYLQVARDRIVREYEYDPSELTKTHIIRIIADYAYLASTQQQHALLPPPDWQTRGVTGVAAASVDGPTSDTPQKWLTVKEAVHKYSHLNEDAIRKAYQQGRLIHKTTGTRVYLDPHDLACYAENFKPRK